MDRDQVVETLRLEPLELEGGMYRRTFADEHASAIYFLIEEGRPTMLHRVASTEIFHHYLGAAATILVLEEGREAREHVVGSDLTLGHRPQIVVPAGAWQAARTSGEWTLLGATMAPAFGWDGFETGHRGDLVERWPEAADAIYAHTSPSG